MENIFKVEEEILDVGKKSGIDRRIGERSKWKIREHSKSMKKVEYDVMEVGKPRVEVEECIKWKRRSREWKR